MRDSVWPTGAESPIPAGVRCTVAINAKTHVMAPDEASQHERGEAYALKLKQPKPKPPTPCPAGQRRNPEEKKACIDCEANRYNAGGRSSASTKCFEVHENEGNQMKSD